MRPPSFHVGTCSCMPCGALPVKQSALAADSRPELLDRHACAVCHWAATPLEGGTPGFASQSDAFTDPPWVFRALAGIRAPVSRLGQTKLDGVPTTRYRLLTNLASFLRPSTGYVQYPLAYRRIQAGLDVWLDAQGRPRQVDETFTGPSSAGRATMRTVVRFMDYEQPVSVQAPPSSLVKFTKRTAAPNPLPRAPPRCSCVCCSSSQAGDPGRGPQAVGVRALSASAVHRQD
jgi:hypothetical protein